MQTCRPMRERRKSPQARQFYRRRATTQAAPLGGPVYFVPIVFDLGPWTLGPRVRTNSPPLDLPTERGQPMFGSLGLRRYADPRRRGRRERLRALRRDGPVDPGSPRRRANPGAQRASISAAAAAMSPSTWPVPSARTAELSASISTKSNSTWPARKRNRTACRTSFSSGKRHPVGTPRPV